MSKVNIRSGAEVWSEESPQMWTEKSPRKSIFFEAWAGVIWNWTELKILKPEHFFKNFESGSWRQRN